MSSAAIYWNPEAYDTSGKALMGRHSAGEGFMRGYLRHGSAERIALWNIVGRPATELEPLVKKLHPTDKPIDWIGRTDMAGLSKIGVANLPVPGIGRYAWGRRLGDPRAYSLCGVTHTTVTARVLDALNDLTIAPTHPWDAVVCTSRAVVSSLRVQSEMLDEYLKERLGAQPVQRAQYVHIPLGINTDEFQRKPADRRRWRDQLSIAPEDIAVLYVGRFNITSKMNPVPMAMALERAARATGRRIHWIVAGWSDPRQEQAFKDTILAHCLEVTVHFVDGRPPENRYSIWAAGDIFLSLSDNIQETFGLTPVEAMAAGLPSIISDWDGYKDTVRHGVDGFRVATYTPSAGLGRDMSYFHSQDWSSYDAFVGGVSQFTAVDLSETVNALKALIRNKDLRIKMGKTAQAQARAVFDWKAIIPRYEALWAELNARRKAAPPQPVRTRNQSDNPWRPDPFQMFASYPTEWLTGTTQIGAAADMTWETVEALLNTPTVRMSAHLLPTVEEVKLVLDIVARQPQCAVADILELMPSMRRVQIERGLVWMAKYGMLTILPRGRALPS